MGLTNSFNPKGDFSRPYKYLENFTPYTFELGDENFWLDDGDQEDKIVPPDVFPLGTVLILYAAAGNVNITRGLGVAISAGGLSSSDQVLTAGNLMILRQVSQNAWYFNKIGF